MVHGFLGDTIYNDERDPERYVRVIRAIRMTDHWQLWVVFFNRANDERVEENHQWLVSVDSLPYWSYGKFGPH